jgi:hypothetical protein
MFLKLNSIVNVTIPCDIPNGGAFTQPTTFFTSFAGALRLDGVQPSVFHG